MFVMKDYIEYLNLPTQALIVLAIIFLVLNLTGEFLEVKGKAVPEFMKFRKRIARKKAEREAIAEMMKTLPEVKKSLDEFNAHYSADNITMRDKWMHGVDDHVCESEKWKKEFCEKLDKNTEITIEIRIESMRSEIIRFAQCVVDQKYPVTREQFNRIFKLHKKYEKILKENDMTNGEVDTAIRIIRESYEEHLRNHSFLENELGYELPTHND